MPRIGPRIRLPGERSLAGTIDWDAKLATVAGKHAPKIEKAFGYRTVGDLLLHYPRRWVDKGSVSTLGDVEPDEYVTVLGRVARSVQHSYVDRRRGGVAYRLEVVVATEDAELLLTFFDKLQRTANWRRNQLAVGRSGLFSGKVGTFRQRLQLVNPETHVFGADGTAAGSIDGTGDATSDAAADAAKVAAAELWDQRPRLLAIYPATTTVQSWQLADAITLALELVHEVPDLLPPEIRDERDFLGTRQALAWLHRPDTWAQKETAARRLRFDEAFVTQTVLAQRRAELMALGADPRTGRAGGLLDRFDARLPFELTAGQRETSREILDDLAGGHPMHRLLHGEVGSGKTVVALRAMLRVVDSGAQAALLAPTEVLAQQHHRSITGMLGDLAAGGMLGGADGGTQVALLTGSLGAAARRQAMLDAASGSAGIVVGTHALLEDKVQFADLGFVVVDEQHRFGVEQRAALTAKSTGQPPHVLVMTATPIPRTVAMTVFGDLSTSTLRELPAGRAPIQTNVVPIARQPAWLQRAWSRIREEVARGHQVYVVCPRIGGDDAPPRPSRDDETLPAAAVEDVAPMLADGPLRGLRLEVLHGRLAPDRKDEVMRSFAAGQIDVLVATTVIEVGVDVAGATMMVVLDAERFGVSQLHQLRGRVGRGGLPGLCLLVTGAPADSPAHQRLVAVAATTDGFELSRLDLVQRREGDVLGVSQSGRRSSLRLLSVLDHEEDIIAAREVADRIVSADPGLVAHKPLADQVRRLHDAEQADYLEKA